MLIFLDIGTQYQNCTFSLDHMSEMPVCKVVTILKFYYRREMLPLHDVSCDDIICTWRRVKNDVALYHNVIFSILKAWQ